MSLLRQAEELLKRFSQESKCPICRRYAGKLGEAVNTLSHVYTEMDKVVKEISASPLAEVGKMAENIHKEHEKGGEVAVNKEEKSRPETLLFSGEDFFDSPFLPHNLLLLFKPEKEK